MDDEQTLPIPRGGLEQDSLSTAPVAPREIYPPTPQEDEAAPRIPEAPSIPMQEADRTAVGGAIEDTLKYPPENVQFTGYRPKRLAANEWTKLLVFTHLDDKPADAPDDAPHPVDQVRDEAAQILGDKADEYTDITKDSRFAIPREGEICLIPSAPGLQFNPPERTFYWSEGLTVHREEFGVKAPESLIGQTVSGQITVFLGSIILAEIKLSFPVAAPGTVIPEPLEPTSTKPYRQIFASYSREDVEIVEQVERYAATMGDQYLRDLVSLRAGRALCATP